MLWYYTAAIVLGYAALLLFRDDASEKIRAWIFPVLLVLGILGGLYFGNPGQDENCQSYGTRAGDC